MTKVMPNQHLITDLDIAQLTIQQRQRLDAAHGAWFSSLGHCTLHRPQPAQRVRLWTDTQGRLQRFLFYRLEDRRPRSLHLFGPSDIDPSQVRQLLLEQRVSVARLTMMPASALPRWRTSVLQPRAKRTVMQIVELPLERSAFLGSLGKQTRKHLPYYYRRLKRDLPDVNLFAAVRSQIDPADIERLVHLNRSRVEAKGDRYGGWDSPVLHTRCLLSQQQGLLCGLRQQDRLIAGTLSFVHGDTAYLVLIGHDPIYDSYNLGNVVLWLSMERMIDDGIRQCNLLWGRSFYKKQFGGREEPVCEITYCLGVKASLRCWVSDIANWTARQWGRACVLCRRLRQRLAPRP